MKLQEATAYELKAGHKYLIVFDKRATTKADIADLSNLLKEMNCDAVAIGLATGVQDMKLVDLTTTAEATG